MIRNRDKSQVSQQPLALRPSGLYSFKLALIRSFVVSTSFMILAAPIHSALAAEPSEATMTNEQKHRKHLDELFIWKASEELKLRPEEEMKFTDIIRRSNTRRRQLAERMEATVKDLSYVTTKADAERALARHREAIAESQKLQNTELDQLKALLGPVRMAKYLVVKNDLTDKLRALLSMPSGSSSASGAPPGASTTSTLPSSSLSPSSGSSGSSSTGSGSATQTP